MVLVADVRGSSVTAAVVVEVTMVEAVKPNAANAMQIDWATPDSAAVQA